MNQQRSVDSTSDHDNDHKLIACAAGAAGAAGSSLMYAPTDGAGRKDTSAEFDGNGNGTSAANEPPPCGSSSYRIVKTREQTWGVIWRILVALLVLVIITSVIIKVFAEPLSEPEAIAFKAKVRKFVQEHQEKYANQRWYNVLKKMSVCEKRSFINIDRWVFFCSSRDPENFWSFSTSGPFLENWERRFP
eukprot:GHVH01015864.1.p1 GENE.GHVH01015864.1~~GHVH01015864.1.p1  ORF type:complete len:190 (-),score=26.19 GHVH01015864.1:53-622(-)